MALEIVLITGMSGSGKSVALHALEDAGYYCVDNLPPELLPAFVALEHRHHGHRLAIAMDVRSATSLHQVPQELTRLRGEGVAVHSIFLDATTDTLVRRFSETRRRHPLSHTDLQQGRQALVQTIEVERELLAQLREQSHVIDTSAIRASQLQSYVKSLMATAAQGQLTLVFQSFAFKRGIPMDADYVFDVRMLPNPHYEPALRDLTGLDEPVAQFLRQQPEVALMQAHIAQFLTHWLDMLDRNHRSYVTVAIGCTGGQHRSVYLAERLADAFGDRWTTLRRHRELDGK
ncbi:MAG: RNase adapter RapZ [Acidovorax sp.]|uniref:RNase adapter RapZ n=1 Tax=Acidovorax sp. TaxID=1872122 RepID=UPI0039E41E5C